MIRFADGCQTCQNVQGHIALTPAPRILDTRYWLVEHIHPTAITGWLVVALRRHCAAIHQLTADEMAELGRLQLALCQGLHALLHTEKEYVVQFAERDGFAHVHFHVIARLPDWPESLRGPHVFAAMGEAVAQPLSAEALTTFALALRADMAARWDGA